jgi:TonB family protein
MTHHAHRWTFAISISVVTHAAALAAMSLLSRHTAPLLRMPEGSASRVRVRLLPPEPSASAAANQHDDSVRPDSETAYEAPDDVLEMIGLADLPQNHPSSDSPPNAPADTLTASDDRPAQPADHALQWMQLMHVVHHSQHQLVEWRGQIARLIHAAAASSAADPSPVATRAAAASGAPGIVHGPSPLSDNKPPEYPEQSRRSGQAGTVLLHVVIEVDGRVSGVFVIHPSGFDALDDAAVKALRTWRFVPASENGAAIRSEADVPVEFVLQRAADDRH